MPIPSIVVRAEDPARAAEVVRALGVRLDEPNRPNPRAWHGTLAISVIVTSDDDGCGVHLGPEDFDGAVAALVLLLGTDAVDIAADGRLARVVFPNRLDLTLERDAPRAQSHEPWDVGRADDPRPHLAQHRAALMAAMASSGVFNPRLAGPNLAEHRDPRLWALVVDAPADADLAALEAVAASWPHKYSRLVVRRASEFAPDHLARIDRRAFDL